jgi:hypothetical protein
MGYLLALALQNFSLCNTFTSLRTSPPSTTNIDSAIGQQEHRLGKICAPRAVLIMLNLTADVLRDDPMIRYAVLKVTERLAAANHRNQALLNGIGIVRHVFDQLYTTQSPPLDDAERAVLQKLLRRMLEMGASTADARHIYQRALRTDLTIDREVLEILKTGQRAKWPEHFSFDGTAALQLKEDGGRMFPCPTGFTFMVGNPMQLLSYSTINFSSIDLDLRRKVPNRPAAHDLWCQAFGTMDGQALYAPLWQARTVHNGTP